MALTVVQEVDGTLRVCCGTEDRPLVALQDLEPAGEVGGVIGPWLELEAEVGGQEGGTQLRHQFLACIAFVAMPLAAKVTVEARRVARPVHALVPEDRVVAFRIAECLEGWHPHMVGLDGIVGPVAAVADVGTKSGKEALGTIDTLHRGTRTRVLR